MTKKGFVMFSLVAAFCGALPVLAATISPIIPGMAMTASTTPGGYVAGFYSFALMIGGVLAFGAIVYGGILYAASGGNPGQQSEGKEWVKSALLGLLLLAAAYLILYTINPDLVNLNLPTIQGVNIAAPTPSQPPCDNSNPNGYCPGTGVCQNITAGIPDTPPQYQCSLGS
jgi:type IV secretion system pilin